MQEQRVVDALEARHAFPCSSLNAVPSELTDLGEPCLVFMNKDVLISLTSRLHRLREQLHPANCLEMFPRGLFR